MEVVSLANWDKALTLIGKNSMSNAFLEAGNVLTSELGLHHRKEFRQWNDIVAEGHEALGVEVFPKVDALADSIDEVIAIEGGVEFLKHCVHWDVVSIYMEYAYAHLVTPRFYSILLKVYQSGHFPCGWDEVWPNGKLWVY